MNLKRNLTLLLVLTAMLGAAPSIGAPGFTRMGYSLASFPDPSRPTMPLLGINGSGAGYCVTLERPGEESIVITVPGHILDPVKRDQFNRRPGQYGLKLPTDPGTIVAEYRASVQNAFRHAAQMSGDPRLIALSRVSLVFVDLGDIQVDATKKAPIAECRKSSCYGQGPGCVVTGCVAGCADCIVVRAITMDGSAPLDGPVPPPDLHPREIKK